MQVHLIVVTFCLLVASDHQQVTAKKKMKMMMHEDVMWLPQPKPKPMCCKEKLVAMPVIKKVMVPVIKKVQVIRKVIVKVPVHHHHVIEKKPAKPKKPTKKMIKQMIHHYKMLKKQMKKEMKAKKKELKMIAEHESTEDWPEADPWPEPEPEMMMMMPTTPAPTTMMPTTPMMAWPEDLSDDYPPMWD